jgi:excinuclease ABC subunit C
MFWEELPEMDAGFLEEEMAESAVAVQKQILPLRQAQGPDDNAVGGVNLEGGDVDVEPVPTESAPEIFEDEAAMEQNSVLAAPEEAVPFSPAAFFSALLKQMYLDQGYVPRHIYVPVDFPDRELLADALRERSGHKIEIAAPQRGDKRSLVDLVCQNAKQSYDQRFRVLKPSIALMQEALQDALTLAEPPERIECFDISHIQGAETVASMVVWEKGAMKKADYRKFQVKTVSGVDDFASMREIIHRRYKRLQEDG